GRDRPTSRAQRHGGNRGRLRQADSPGTPAGRGDHGSDLPGRVMTQLVTQVATRATPVDGKWPLTCVGVAGFEPTASSSRTFGGPVLPARSSRSPGTLGLPIVPGSWAGCCTSLL